MSKSALKDYYEYKYTINLLSESATFSRGLISLIYGPNPKKLVPNERYGRCLSTDTLWVVVGQLVRSLQSYKVRHFCKIFKIAEKWAFFLIPEN